VTAYRHNFFKRKCSFLVNTIYKGCFDEMVKLNDYGLPPVVLLELDQFKKKKISPIPMTEPPSDY
jgi:hypothetical protein